MADYSQYSRNWLYDACYTLTTSLAEQKRINTIYESSLSVSAQKKLFIGFIENELRHHPEKEALMLIVMGGCEFY